MPSLSRKQQFIGSEYCVGCANGLDALIWIFRAYVEMGVMEPGDEVIVTNSTMHFSFSVYGTNEIQSMEIINVRQCVWKWTGRQERCDIQIDIPAKNGMYYLRVTQQDGHQAWTSPIYVRKV